MICDNSTSVDNIAKITSNNEATPTVKTKVNTKKKKKKKKCCGCKKKIKMFSLTCKCGSLVCLSCKSPDSHNCTFDYITFEREKLARQNPQVLFAKMETF